MDWANKLLKTNERTVTREDLKSSVDQYKELGYTKEEVYCLQIGLLNQIGCDEFIELYCLWVDEFWGSDDE